MPPKSRTQSPTAPYECSSANCRAKIRTFLEANLHPLVGALVCRKCYKNYGDGNFADMEDGVDSQGDDNFCRWCVDGGDLFGCSNEMTKFNDRCHYSFCKECILLNIPDDPILESNGNQNPWYCYGCKPEKLSKIRDAAIAAYEDLRERDKKLKQSLTRKDSFKEKPKEQQKSDSINRDISSKEKVKSFDITPQKPSSTTKSTSKDLSDSSKKTIPKEKSKDQSQQQDSNKSVIVSNDNKSKDQLQSDAIRKESIKDKSNKEQSLQEAIKTSKDKIKDTKQQESLLKERIIEKPKDPYESNKKETFKTKETISQNTNERKTDSHDRATKELSPPATIRSDQKIKPPKDFICNPRAYNTTATKKRRVSDRSDVVPSKEAQDIFTPLQGISQPPQVPKMSNLTKEELIKSLEDFRKVGCNSVREVNIIFGKIIDMFNDKELIDARRRRAINDEIESLRRPVLEYATLIKNLKTLNNS